MLLTSMKHLARRCITVDMSRLLQNKTLKQILSFSCDVGRNNRMLRHVAQSHLGGAELHLTTAHVMAGGCSRHAGPGHHTSSTPGWAGGQRKFSSHEAWSQVFGILHMLMSQESPMCRTRNAEHCGALKENFQDMSAKKC